MNRNIVCKLGLGERCTGFEGEFERFACLVNDMCGVFWRSAGTTRGI